MNETLGKTQTCNYENNQGNGGNGTKVKEDDPTKEGTKKHSFSKTKEK